MSPGEPTERYELDLYIAGPSARARAATTNLKEVCDRYLGADSYAIRVIDVIEDPAEAEQARVLATPTVIRRRPTPERRVIGDLSESEQLRDTLEI